MHDMLLSEVLEFCIVFVNFEEVSSLGGADQKIFHFRIHELFLDWIMFMLAPYHSL
jgi:hypothetical protein